MARKGRKPKQKPVTLPNIVIVEVENPLYQRSHSAGKTNPRTIPAAYNMRESYTGFLYGKSLISQAEKQAGDKVRQAFEMMGGAGARAIDYTREHVDGGMMADPISAAQWQAGAILRECHTLLGPAGHDLTIKLAGEGQWPKDMAPASNEMQRYLSQRFRECLETLAIHWGYQRVRIVATKCG